MNITEITAPVQTFLDEFEIQFKNKLSSSVPLADHVVHYIAGKRGKRFRPLLVFLAAQLHGEINQKVINAGIVVEMFHTATLLHDDVVDESHLRRGAPTINDLWDNKISVLVGDFLFSKTLSGISALRDLEAIDILSAAAERITEGELLQVALAEDPNASERKYFEIISKKTAALFGASCQLGVLATKRDDEHLRLMDRFGENFGMAFQIMDDLLDFVGDTSKLGKPIGNDLREGKITLPLIHALKTNDGSKKDEIIKWIDQGVDEDKVIQKIIQYTKNRGGVDYARHLAQSYAQKAQQALNTYPDSPEKQRLVSLVQSSVDRET